jgi:multiple antibiotic resistance protein
MIEQVRQLLDAVAMLFVVFDSLGNIPIFYALTAGMSEEERERVFAKSVVVASTLLLLFTFAGTSVLDYYGVSFSDFKVAGGIVLLTIALQGMFGRIEAETLRAEEVAIVPMATPLLAGPGSMYTVVYLSRVYGLAPTVFSIAANTLIAYLVLAKSGAILSKIGKNAVLALSRIFSLLLAAIAVSMIRSGLAETLLKLGG